MGNLISSVGSDHWDPCTATERQILPCRFQCAIPSDQINCILFQRLCDQLCCANLDGESCQFSRILVPKGGDRPGVADSIDRPKWCKLQGLNRLCATHRVLISWLGRPKRNSIGTNDRCSSCGVMSSRTFSRRM